MLSMGMALGQDLKLFDAVAEVASKESPKTAEVIAEKAKLKPR